MVCCSCFCLTKAWSRKLTCFVLYILKLHSAYFFLTVIHNYWQSSTTAFNLIDRTLLASLNDLYFLLRSRSRPCICILWTSIKSSLSKPFLTRVKPSSPKWFCCHSLYFLYHKTFRTLCQFFSSFLHTYIYLSLSSLFLCVCLNLCVFHLMFFLCLY